MSPCRSHFNRGGAAMLALCCALALSGPPGFARAASDMIDTTAVVAPELRGTTLDGRPFDLAALRGKVVMVLFWSTDCAVCRDKMPELRANLKGWQGRPFELVGVSTDRDRAAIETHHRLVQLTVPESQRFTSLWTGDSQHRNSFGPPGQLPAVFLLDKSGRVVESHHGRVPPQAWDRIADLL
ncbi:peroxiredoxin family protein [Hydrogenophaga sp.]|uniref:peroxiredoxin family protein n=1 Tax=Hydrogenophaga sp. TaxID=1904254 RepID=UPI003D12917A